MTTLTAPPRRPDLGGPELVAPPARRRPWLAIAAGIIGVLLVIGVGSTLISGTTETAPRPATPVVADTSPTMQEVAVKAAPLSDEAANELVAGANSATPAEMSTHLDNAALLYIEIAGLVAPVDGVIADRMYSAADHLLAASAFVVEGDFNSATTEIEAATADIDAATTRLQTYVEG